jgi:hypothetical protein
VTSQEIEIEALKAALAESTRILELLNSEPRWMPVRENQTIWNMANRLRVAGNAIFIDMSDLGEMEIPLPAGYALCRLSQPKMQRMDGNWQVISQE